MLEQVARELSDSEKLQSLFRPDGATKDLFDKALKLLEGRAGTLTKAGLFLRRKKIFAALRDNGFGLCTGLANDNAVQGKPPLTVWLADLIDKVAGKTDGPLTFRDLHSASVPASLSEKMAGMDQRSIDLRAVTTCLTFGRPVEFPLSQRIFAFDPAEWARFFPPRIIQHLKDEASNIDSSLLARDGKLALPLDGLPVVVAARMSLSFPVLFTMIPLWSPNFHAPENPLERVWFSDGGITSNFPMHLFDALYPRWPTLGINLQYSDTSGFSQRSRLQRDGTLVFIPKNRREGVLDLWNLFDAGDDATENVLGFGKAIFESAKGWHDNAYLRLPGYRDRIAEIWLQGDEGGLNLNMEDELIEGLVRRGQQAGQDLAANFADLPPSDPMSWDGHRWARFRSGMAGVMEWLIEFKRSAGDDPEASRALTSLLSSVGAPPCYKFDSDAQRRAAEEATRKLIDCAREIETLAQDVCSNAQDPSHSPFCEGPRPAVKVGTRAPF